MHESPELLAPAGNWDCLRAAVANGADAVYFGLPKFNARMRADNFKESEMPTVVDFCHRHGVKAYAAFNTLVFTGELEAAASQLRLLNAAGIDALIVQDIGLALLAARITPDLALHASTQMTLTSPEGVRFAEELGVCRVVLARELSLRDIKKFGSQTDAAPGMKAGLEVFVHGALCVAYSGQCLTSESLGQRSANRGECAQACRMPYQLLVDGTLRDLGDRRYLLSPQDLAAVDEIPELTRLGVVSFKIEGRLKSPEYVAAVTQVYRKTIDAAVEHRNYNANGADRYQLEMTFSRGFFTGWLHGANHQQLVAARFGKKRGPFAGFVLRSGGDFVEINPQIELKPGDGVVFDDGGDTDTEQGGRLWQVKNGRLFFERGRVDFSRIKSGDRLWKTDDPALNHRLRKSYEGNISISRAKTRVDLRVSGRAGEPMTIEAQGIESIRSATLLETARTAPLTTEKLREHLGRFGGTVYELGHLENNLDGEVILPIAGLNRMRRDLAGLLDAAGNPPRRMTGITVGQILSSLTATQSPASAELKPTLHLLCRTMEQIGAALEAGVSSIYTDFEDIRRYKEAVELVHETKGTEILLATPRIQKAGEQGFFKLIENAEPDGVIIRNPGAIEHFRDSDLIKVGDFSLNVANPVSAGILIGKGLQRLTVSYDLNIRQALDLIEAAPRDWFELTLHQHMPMFHMDHCVFAAFLSGGTDHTNCGRPCDRHRVHLRDRTGVDHPLRADVGCRNTLFNATAQTGALFFRELMAAGLRQYRVELLEETAAETREVIQAYQALLHGSRDGASLWCSLGAQSQLGVTTGTLEIAQPRQSNTGRNFTTDFHG